MKALIPLSIFMLLSFESVAQEYFIIDINKDTLNCDLIEKNGTKCTQGKDVTKFKSQEVIAYKMGDTTYYAVTGFKKKRHVHAFEVISSSSYKIMQYDFMEAQTSGPSLPKTKYLICGTQNNFLTELLLNETTATTLKKYFSGCPVFDKELKKFSTDSKKRRFPLKDFRHLINIYSNSCVQ